MAHIDPFRMLGRFDYAVAYLMKKYNLAMTREVPDWPTLLTALSLQVNDYDRVFCQRMASASRQYVDETQSTTLNQFEADHQKNLGSLEAEFIFNNQPYNYSDKILEERDFFIDIERGTKQKKKAARRNLIISLGIVAVIILGIIIYNLPYFAEQRAYAHLEEVYNSGTKEMLEDAVSQYVEKYPEGKNFSEALYLPVRFVKNSQDVTQVLEAVDNYIHPDPKGRYVKECKALSDSIWDIEIDKYKSFAESSASKEGADFVIKMLQYMKKNNIRTVEVTGVPHLFLKEYSEYPSDLRKFMESLPPDPIPGLLSGQEPKLPDDLVTIKDKITSEDTKEWVYYVIAALQKGFNQVLTPNFIDFVEFNNEDKNADKRMPKVTVDYTVSTQETVSGIPDIWVYTEGNSTYVVSAALYLGIGMSFDAVFSLPGEDLNYTVKGFGDAGVEELKNVGTNDVYSVMCELSTFQFAEQIAKEFGLPPTPSDGSQQ